MSGVPSSTLQPLNYQDELPSTERSSVSSEPIISLELGMVLCVVLSLTSLAMCCYNFREFRHVCSDRRERRRRNEELTRQRELERIREKYKNDPDLRSQVILQRIEKRSCSIENIKCQRRKDSLDSTLTERTEVSLDLSSSSDNADGSSENDSVVVGVGLENDIDNCASSCNDENVCTVCLSEFEPGDELAWSKDLRCNHCFHAECLIPWLLKHEECPYCRTPMLEDDDFLVAAQECNTISGSTEGEIQQSNQELNQTMTKEEDFKDDRRNEEDDDIEAQRTDCPAHSAGDFFQIHDGQVIFGRDERTGAGGGSVVKSVNVDVK